MLGFFFVFKQKTAYEMRISDWSSDVCSSDLIVVKEPVGPVAAFTPWNFPINQAVRKISAALAAGCSVIIKGPEETPASCAALVQAYIDAGLPAGVLNLVFGVPAEISEYLIPHPVIRKRSEEHTSELQSLMRISYAVFCLK